jgi:hypothetical protein
VAAVTCAAPFANYLPVIPGIGSDLGKNGKFAMSLGGWEVILPVALRRFSLGRAEPPRFSPSVHDKGRRRAVSKPYVTVYGYARVSTDGQSVLTPRCASFVRPARAKCSAKCERSKDRPQRAGMMGPARARGSQG